MKQLLLFLMLTFSMFVQAQIEITDLEHGNFSSANNVQYVTYVDNEQEYAYEEYIKKLEKEMKQAASDLQFERAAQLRDIIFEYKAKI